MVMYKVNLFILIYRKEMIVESINQTEANDKKNNATPSNSKKGNKNLFIGIACVLVAVVLLVVFSSDNEPHPQTFGDVAFTAPGEWAVTEEKDEVMGGMPAHTQVISNKSYEGLISTQKNDEPMTPEVRDSVISEFFKGETNYQDKCSSKLDGIAYAGAWSEEIIDTDEIVQATYVVLDEKTNQFTIIVFSGDKDYKDQIVDTYKSVKFKNIPLYTK